MKLLTDRSTVASVTLYWRVGDNAWQPVAMTADGDVYSGDLPGQPAHTAIEYYIQAVDGVSLVSVAPENAPVVFERNRVEWFPKKHIRGIRGGQPADCIDPFDMDTRRR